MREVDDDPGDADTGEERGGKFGAVVRMELEFGQEIGAGDAEEGSGAEGEGFAQPAGVGFGPRAGAEMEGQGSQWGNGGEGEGDTAAEVGGDVLGGHQGGDGESSERFVQDDRQRGSQAQQTSVLGGSRGGGGGHGESIEHGMEGETEGHADPTEITRGAFGEGVGMPAGFERAALGDIVMVKGEEALEEEQGEEAGQGPTAALGGGPEFRLGVGQQGQERKRQHQAGHETHRHLEARVGEFHPGR